MVKIGKAILCETVKHEGKIFRICAGEQVLVDLTNIKVLDVNGQKMIFAKFASAKKPWEGTEQVNVKYLFHRDSALHEKIMCA